MTEHRDNHGVVSIASLDDHESPGMLGEPGTYLGAAGLGFAVFFPHFTVAAVAAFADGCMNGSGALRIDSTDHVVLVNLQMHRQVFILRGPSHAVDELLASVEKVYTSQATPPA